VFLLLIASLITIVLVTIQTNQDASVNITDTAISTNITIEDVRKFSSSSNSIFWSLVITASISLLNFVVGKIFTQWLTTFEQHYTWTAFKTNHLTKYFLFRILNVAIVFLIRWLVQNEAEIIKSIPLLGDFANDRINKLELCPLSRDAEQFLYILVVDYTVIRLATLFGNWFKYRWYTCCHPDTDILRSDKGRPEFDIAEEYLELLYRQFIIYLAIPIFPIVSLVALILGLVEYPIDKLVLLTISKTPPLLSGSMKSYVVFYMFFYRCIWIFCFSARRVLGSNKLCI